MENFEPSPPRPAEDFVQNLVDDAATYAKRDPTKAVLTAFGVGLLLNILPTRFIAGTVSTVATTVLKPTLMTLGVIKVCEIYLDQSKKHHS